jgi:hypothetical protein
MAMCGGPSRQEDASVVLSSREDNRRWLAAPILLNLSAGGH